MHNEKTKFGSFLQKIGNTFGDITTIGEGLLQGTPAGTVISTVKNLLEGKMENQALTEAERIRARELKLELELASQYFETELVKTQQLEMDSARKYNASIQNDPDSTSLAKIVPYFLDLSIVLTWIGATFYIAFNAFRGTSVSDGIWGLYSTVTGLATQIIGFHRGSSIGSKRKDLKLT